MSIVVDHGASRGGRWLRERRFRIAFWIAVAEAALVVFAQLRWWQVVILLGLSLAAYFGLGRTSESDTLRQVTWIAAVSQALVAMVPFVVALVGTVFLLVLGVAAVVALVVLFNDRR